MDISEHNDNKTFSRLVVSGSSDNTIRLWDIECGACLRTLEGHEELVRCIRWREIPILRVEVPLYNS